MFKFINFRSVCSHPYALALRLRRWQNNMHSSNMLSTFENVIASSEKKKNNKNNKNSFKI